MLGINVYIGGDRFNFVSTALIGCFSAGVASRINVATAAAVVGFEGLSSNNASVSVITIYALGELLKRSGVRLDVCFGTIVDCISPRIHNFNVMPPYHPLASSKKHYSSVCV